MSTELTTALKTASPTQINKLFGITSDKPKPIIPVLKVNEHDDEGSAPKGTFVYDDGDRVLHAKEVRIRSFVKAYQYRLFCSSDKSKNDISTIGLNFKHEFRSISGRIACGKLSKKAFEKISANATSQQLFFQKEAKCKLLVFGLVSGTFTDLDTKGEVVLKDALCVWSVSQSGFMSINDAIVGIERERRAVPLTPIRVHLKKEKTGTVTFHVPVPEVLGETAELDVARDSAHLEVITKFIKDTNDYVDSKYNIAVNGKSENDNFAHVAKDSGIANDPLDF